MMKKILGIILAAMMLVLPACAAFADEIPEPEGGKKFDTDWAIFGMTVSIVYEEEGYRVDIREYDPAEQKGTVWEYACLYNEEKDVLESMASLKYGFTDKEGAESVDEFEYDDLDAENQVTVFAIDENGMLTWQDGRGQDGADLAFSDIGRFDGTWVNQGQYTKGREFTETLILSEDGSARILLEYQGQDYADLEGEFFAAGGLLTVRYEDDTGQQQRSYTYELAGNLLRLTGNGKTVEYTRE